MKLKKKKGFIREWTEVIGGAVILFLFLRAFFFQAFQIPSESMEDTLLVGDYLFVNKFIYGAQVPFTDIRLPDLREPKRGDIVVFTYPEDGRTTYIKRVIGTPGDTVEIKDKVVYINGEATEESFTKHLGRTFKPEYRDPRVRGGGNMHFFGPVTIEEGHYFLMGDNRDNSQDSRVRGQVPFEEIRGKASFIYFSINRDSKMPRFSRIGDLIR
ncbi:MAG: signal peptidase I [Candidatus Eisenbacteria bacterium]|uniref:Signal peptidase I n=1 Tax=Eiseniibacteriota bacterium TaxID=2212470 RepID=A0A7Y2E4S2_UNCEI|nr:signal peptidase I [Candidatus Eisenbacteria bacterium]